jgi:hypothetical protein
MGKITQRQLDAIRRAASVAHSMVVTCETCGRTGQPAPMARHIVACRRRSVMPPAPPTRTSCEVCGKLVFTKRVERHRQKCERRAIERAERARRRAEARAARPRRSRAKMDPERLSAERRVRMERLNATMTPEQRSDRSRAASAGMTPEARRERSRRGGAGNGTRTCPWCGITGSGPTMVRWHGEKCRRRVANPTHVFSCT